MTLSIDRQILEIAATNDLIVTRLQLKAVGVSNGSINRRTPSPLEPLAPGVFSVGPPSRRGLMRAALSANLDGSLADVTAAELLDMPVRRHDTISVVVPHGSGTDLARPDVVLRRSRHLPVDDVDCGDLCRTSVERTICDLASRQDPQNTQRLIEWCITHRRMTTTSFQACLRCYRRRGRRGSKLLGVLDQALLGGQPIPASELERRGIDLLQKHGIGGWELHFTPPWSNGVSGIVDLAWPGRCLIVELDGRRWHSTTEAQSIDRGRDRDARAHGWTPLRFGWQEVVERPRSFINELRFFLDLPNSTSE